MEPTSATLLLVSALGLIYFLKTGRRWAVLMGGLFVIFVTSSFVCHALGRVWINSDVGFSTAARVEFFLVGISLTGLAIPREGGQFLSVLPSTLGMMIANVAMIGFVFFDANFMSQSIFFAKLGLNTTVCFLVFHLAILFANRRPVWPHLLLGDRPGSKLLRALLPCAVFGPLILGEASYIATQTGNLSVRVSIAVLVVASGWLVIAALFLATRWINTVSDQEKVALRHLHEQELALSNAEAMTTRVHKASSLGRVAGGVSHEFNNILSVIQGNLELLRESGSLQKTEGAHFLDEALEATRRGAGLTQKLLSYGEKSVLDPETLVLDRKIGALVGMLRRFVPEQVEFIVKLDAEHRRLHVDQGQLEQAIFNLVSNAADALDGDGRVVLSTGGLALERSRRVAPDNRVMPKGAYLYVSVSDTGRGIDADRIARITEPFYSTKSVSKSPGLGLSMVHGFCLQSGGFLEFASTPGVGSRFIMYFPERGKNAAEQFDPQVMAQSDEEQVQQA